MKLKVIIFLMCLVSSISMSFRQIDMECRSNLSLAHQYVKSKNFERAYAPWKFVLDSCPKVSIAIYSDGEKILNDKIQKTSGVAQKTFLNSLLELWEMRAKHFPKKTPKGAYLSKAFQLTYDHNEVFQKSDIEIYEGFDKAFKLDKKTFNNPKSLYTYFSLIVNLQEAGNKKIKEVFDKYDDVNEKIETEVKNYSIKLNKLVETEDQGVVLSRTETQRKRSYESYLKNYSLISANMARLLDEKADCVNLIPLYTRDFETHKNNAVWLKRAVSRMYHKECTNDPLYEKLAIAYDEVAPSADTKFFVAVILMKKGKTNEAQKYLADAYELETDVFKKSKLAYSIGLMLKKKGNYAKARNYFRKALKLNPSNGKPHLAIAAMYAKSANNCGKDEFEKRAVYWLAEKEAKKAFRVDPTIRRDAERAVKRYQALAPTKQMIFICACSGKEIKFSCWINDKVVVPEIKG